MAMGMNPLVVRDLSLWQFHAAAAGWAKANGAEVTRDLTDDEFNVASAALDEAPETTL